MVLFIVYHEHVIDEDTEDVRLIGIYSTQEKAEEAVERSKQLPGFRSATEGFTIDGYTVNEDHWDQGYETIRYCRLDDRV